ncbi:Dyp-type peroxidase [Marinomonas sp. TW1]|uniref:Dyp-type peroxidase n=1 Tax=Marinomonas sp. TW1 TaxID=1561203 RepID=UPI0007AFD8E9|nr:Dyp-type peroxidase [Marinomonas sp. TW1]KZN13356.1 peroxidase [Marinomonas sp. TW1]
MTPYQSGIIAEPSSDACFVTLNVKRSHMAEFKQSLARIPDLVSQTQAEFPNAELHAAIGFSKLIWSELDNEQPQELDLFPALKGPETDITPTDVDLVLHIRAMRHDASFQLTQSLFALFGGCVELVEEVPCFLYKDSRDLTGFVDGTENPQGEQRKAVALVGDEDAQYRHGSYFNLMRFSHNLTKWQTEDLKTQEDTYGRTKEDNEEYPSAEKPPHAHTKRTSLKDEHGKSIEILRQSMPYGNLMDQGLMFASYGKSASHFNLMLESMILGDEEGHTDHLMKYTTAKTAQAFFIPANAWFNKFQS